MDVRAKQRLSYQRCPLFFSGLGSGFALRHLSRSTLSGKIKLVRLLNRKIKLFIFALSFAVLLICADQNIFAQKRTPRFEDYPITAIYKGRIAKPRLGKREIELYEDRFKWTVENQTVNFAGRYIVTTWSCGSTCLFGTVLDAKTGKPSWWKVRLNYSVAKPVEYRLNSSLIILSGCRGDNDDEKTGTHYFRLKSGRFVHLKSVPSKQRPKPDCS